MVGVFASLLRDEKNRRRRRIMASTSCVSRRTHEQGDRGLEFESPFLLARSTGSFLALTSDANGSF